MKAEIVLLKRAIERLDERISPCDDWGDGSSFVGG